ncbi:hypothetical protein DFH06DRAFT_1333865 [Mycena polygramma]|nr:hypothetical protein DFH06DRAFT_1333865 [Mycena polygramma]
MTHRDEDDKSPECPCGHRSDTYGPRRPSTPRASPPRGRRLTATQRTHNASPTSPPALESHVRGRVRREDARAATTGRVPNVKPLLVVTPLLRAEGGGRGDDEGEDVDVHVEERAIATPRYEDGGDV